MAIIIIVIIWFEFIYIYIWIIDITVKYHRHHITFIINTFLSGTCYIQLLIVITILKLDCINSFLKIRTLTCFGKASRYLHDFRLSQIDIFHVSCEGLSAMIFPLAPPKNWQTTKTVWFPFLENMMFSGTFLKSRPPRRVPSMSIHVNPCWEIPWLLGSGGLRPWRIVGDYY